MSDFRVDGTLTADVAGFVRSIREARDSIRGLIDDVEELDRELDSLRDRRIRVSVDIDGRDEIRQLRDDLDRLSGERVSVRVDLDIDRDSLRRLRNDLRDIRDVGDVHVNVRVDVDGLAELRTAHRLLRTISRTWRVDVDIDVDGLITALTTLVALRTALNGLGDAANGATGGLEGAGGAAGGMIGPFLTLLPLLVAVAGVLAGVGAGIFGAMSTAALGVGAFALFAIPTFKKIAEAASGGEAAIAKLPEPMQVAARNLIDLKNRFSELQKEIQPVALEVFAEALNVARAGMEAIAPVAKPAGEAIRDLLANMAEGLKGDDWTKFFNYLRDNVGWFIRVWGTAVGNFITGIANMIRAFDPLSKFVSKGFLGMSESFLKWSQNLENNKSFQEFVAFVIENGPILFQALKDFIGALFQITVAMAPIGAQMLQFVAGLLSTVAAFLQSNPQFAQFLAYLIPMAGFILTVGAAISMLAGVVAGISGPALLMVAGIAAIIGIIYTWWTQCESFREFIKEMWARIGATFSEWIGEIKAMIQDWLPAIVELWNKYGKSIMDYVKGMWTIISGVISGALKAIRGIVNIVLGLLTGDWKRVWNGIKQVLSGVWTAIKSIISGGKQAVLGLVRGLLTAIGNIMKGAWDLLYNAGKAIIKGLISGIKSMGGAVKDAAKSVLQGARNILPFSPAKEGPFSGRGWTTFSGASMIDGLIKGMRSRQHTLRDFMRTSMGDVQGSLRASVSSSITPMASGLQTAAAAGVGGQTIHFHEGAFKVYNPAAETASESTTKTMQKVSRFGIFEN